MAVIPTIQPRPSFDIPQSPAPQLDNPLAEVFGGIGNALQDLAAGWQAATAGDYVAKLQQFKFDETNNFNKATHDLAPDKAVGFAGNYDAGFRERAGKFMESVGVGLTPGDQRRLNAQIGDIRLNLFNSASDVEQKQTTAFATGKIDQGINTTILPRAGQVASLPDDANKPTALAALEADAYALIDASPLSAAEKEQRKLEVHERIQTEFASKLPPSEKSRLDPTTADETVVSRIIKVEGTGKNPKSSAEGPGQFVDDTWVDLIKRYRPDLAEGLSKSEILSLRSGPFADQLGKEMTRAYSKENAAYLQYHKIDATAGNLYLSHFLGPQGAVNMLGAGPDDIAAEINPEAAKANPSIFYWPSPRTNHPDLSHPKTAAEVAQWAADKMAGTYHTNWAEQLDAIPFDQKVNLGHDGSTEFIAQQTATAKAAKDAYDAQLNAAKNGVMDGSFGLADLSTAYGDGKGWLTDAGDRKAVLDMIQQRDKDALSLGAAQALMQNTAVPINAFDPEQKKAVNLWYDNLAGGGADLYEGDGTVVAVLRATMDRSGLIPDSAKSQILSGMYSPDATRRERAFTIADGLYRENPAAMAQAFSTEDLKRIDVYQRLAGIVPKEVLAEEMNPLQSPQQMQLREARRNEGRAIAQKIDTNTIIGAFDANGWVPGGGASGPVDALQQTALRSDYEEAYAEAYARVPNESDAQEMADKWMKLKWGPTDVGSEGASLMSYPPERYYPNVAGSHDWMDAQLEDEVKAQYPDATNWWIVPDPQTEADISAKVAPAYRVMTQGSDGAYRLLSNRVRAGGPDEVVYSAEPALVRFDYQRAEAEAAAKFMDARKREADMQRRLIETGQTPSSDMSTGIPRPDVAPR